ncbi:MAG TPA: flagellar basal body L-ring protein FlgH [Fimbriimonadaceae bacterium]|nr:flagellar basal body L-ring protein FlgH [Fimbriimonadaceae bacterium]
MKAILSGLFVLTLVGTAFGQVIDKNEGASVGSLWSDSMPNPYIDRVARREGDLITILISETSIAQFKASTNAKKDDGTNVFQKLFIPLLDRIFKPFETGAKSDVSGEGQTNQQGKMQARMTGVVRKVLPNGNMIIEGSRLIATNKEMQTFKLVGVIRRDDVRPDNTVRSESIAEAEIRMEGKGMIADRQRRGLLTRILDWLF